MIRSTCQAATASQATSSQVAQVTVENQEGAAAVRASVSAAGMLKGMKPGGSGDDSPRGALGTSSGTFAAGRGSGMERNSGNGNATVQNGIKSSLIATICHSQ